MNRSIALVLTVALAGVFQPAKAQTESTSIVLKDKTPAAIQAEVTRAAYKLCRVLENEIVSTHKMDLIQECAVEAIGEAMAQVALKTDIAAPQLAANSTREGAR